MKRLQWILVLIVAGVVVVGAGCSSDKGTTPTLAPSVPDTAPPLSPDGLATLRVDQSGFIMTWAANTEADLDGYRVYLYQPTPERELAYVLQNPNGLTKNPRFKYGGGFSQAVWVRVAAVDVSGNESALSWPFQVLPLVEQAPGLDSPNPDGADEPPPGLSDPSSDEVNCIPNDPK